MLSQENDGNPPPPPPPPIDPDPEPEEEKVLAVSFNASEAIISITNTVEGKLEYYLYNISGMVVDSGKLSEEKGQIDMSDKSTGMYFIYVKNTSDGTSFTKKVIVSKQF
nr:MULTISPECIES: T9SS type A sorting domain-containing protein [unclassified Aquimarina]